MKNHDSQWRTTFFSIWCSILSHFLELKVSLLLKKLIKDSLFVRPFQIFGSYLYLHPVYTTNGLYVDFKLSEKLQFWKVKTSDFGKGFLKCTRLVITQLAIKSFWLFFHFWQLKMVEMSNAWNLVMEESKMICWNLWKTCDMWAANEPNHEKTWIS